MLLGQADDQLVLHERDEGVGVLEAEGQEAGGAEGGVGGDGDALGPAEVQQLLLDEVGVVLDLEGGGRDAGVPQHVVDELGLEVGDADGPREALVDDRLHGRPGDVHGRVAADDLGLAVVVPAGGVPDRRVDVLQGPREVDQVQVEVVEAPVREGPPDRGLDLVAVLEDGPQLRRDEELVARHQAVLNGAGDALAAILLVTVIWSSEIQSVGFPMHLPPRQGAKNLGSSIWGASLGWLRSAKGLISPEGRYFFIFFPVANLSGVIVAK